MATAVDFAATLIPARDIKAAGHQAVLCYVSPSRPGSNFGAKPVTRAYTDSLRAEGLDVVSIWQYGKPGNAQAPSDWTTGFDGGVRMARAANDQHLVAGGSPNAPIYFAVDEDLSLANWNAAAVEFFRGVNSVLGVERTGIYGKAGVLYWAKEDGVADWYWQTKAWSAGEILYWAHLYQRVVDTPSNPGPKIAGSSVDVNDIQKPDFGQWAAPAPHTPTETPVATKPDFTELNRLGNSRSPRYGARVTNFLLHTQEGNGTAESLAGYLNNSDNGVSYHYTVRDGVVCDVVNTDFASWSVLDANPYTINLCFAGSRAGWSREDWLRIEGDLRIAAYLAVEDAKKYGFSTEVITPPYHEAPGISDHRYVTWELGIGTHTDVGDGFPWDVFEGFVREYAEGRAEPNAPRPNAIDDVQAQNPWLGSRFLKEELKTPDGKGRFAQFDKGFIYWSPDSGAHPIPNELFGKFAAFGWEAGPLGYPVTDPATVKNGDGWVQGFQGGAIYRKNGQDAHVIWGEIRRRWNDSGFESGPLGWPTSDEVKYDTGAYQRFENGIILWSQEPAIAMSADGFPLK